MKCRVGGVDLAVDPPTRRITRIPEHQNTRIVDSADADVAVT